MYRSSNRSDIKAGWLACLNESVTGSEPDRTRPDRADSTCLTSSSQRYGGINWVDSEERTSVMRDTRISQWTGLALTTEAWSLDSNLILYKDLPLARIGGKWVTDKPARTSAVHLEGRHVGGSTAAITTAGWWDPKYPSENRLRSS